MNKDVSATSLISLHGGNNEESKQYYMGANIYFEAIVTATNKIFRQCMIGFVNVLKFNSHKYQTNGKSKR